MSAEDRRQLRAKVHEEWFAELPESEFTSDEDSLRVAILDHLTSCERGVTRLVDLLNVEAVKIAKSQFIQLTINISKWLEARLGGGS